MNKRSPVIEFRHEMVAGKETGLAVAQQVLAWDE
jgi:hypothetical protein